MPSQRFAIVPSAAPKIARLPGAAQRVARLCDGRRTPAEVARAARLPGESVAQALLRLRELGVVVEMAAPAAPGAREALRRWLGSEPMPGQVATATPVAAAPAPVAPAPSSVVAQVASVAAPVSFSDDEEAFFASPIDHLADELDFG